jgi:hypothetical protein
VRIVVLTTVLPGGRRGGGEIVTQSVVDALREGGRDVVVLGYARPGTPESERPGELCMGQRPIETSTAGPRSLGWMVRALATGTPYSVAKYRSRSYVDAAEKALGNGTAAVIVDHAQSYFAIRGAGDLRVPMIFLAHNAEGEAYARLAGGAAGPAGWATSREARQIRKVESDLARRADQVWTLTAEDREYFRSLHPAVDVRALEIASSIEATTEAGAPTCDAALIGTWSWRPNALGLDWFSGEVVPKLPADFAIEVAGPASEHIRGRHPNVVARGVVADAQQFLSTARVVAVPALAGGGVQVKTLDAIASGAPVVATSVAVRGLRELPDSVAVADDAAGFARELRRFAADGERQRPRQEALEWSRARRARLRAAVNEWAADLRS